MTLPALPEESFQRVLCVVAHPDDMEYGTSAAVARWTARGIEVGYLLLTRGEAGMPNPPEETARLRVAEQQAACAVVGVKHLTVLEHPDGVLLRAVREEPANRAEFLHDSLELLMSSLVGKSTPSHD